MKLDALVMPGSLKNVSGTARYLEELGFDTLWTLETQHNPFSPLVLSAEHTRTMKLGTSIAVAFPRSPMVLAHMAWDLQEFSAGGSTSAWAPRYAATSSDASALHGTHPARG